MNRVLLFFYLIIPLVYAAQSAQAQSTCAQTLRTARTVYDQGRLHELPALLESCLRQGFTKQEQVEAYKLLTLAYIYLEEPAKADQSILGLLRTDPYFELNEASDPAEFIALYKTFRTTPIYRFGAKLGVNASSPNVTGRVYAIDGLRAEYTPAVNFQVASTFEIPVNQKITLNPEVYFFMRSFNYTSHVSLENNLENTSDGQEKQSWISLPVTVQYALFPSRVNPYISLGIATDYLLASQISLNNIRVNANTTPEQSETITERRNRIIVSAIASAGIKLKLGGGFVVSEIRYLYGLMPVNDPTTAFDVNEKLLFDKGYADSEFSVNSMSISAGYIFNVFKPKKLRCKK